MCERLTLTCDLSDIQQLLPFDRITFAYKPKSGITPTQSMPVIVQEKGERTLAEYRWGMVPFWGKDSVLADSETLPEKRGYRKLFASHRCLIPCSGFYGWRQEKKERQWIHIGLRQQKLFAVAGLYEIWRDPRGGEFRTCSVLTTRTNRMLEHCHVRPPAILDAGGIKVWSDPSITDIDLLQSYLRPVHDELMFAYPVTERSIRLLEEREEEEALPPAKYAWIKK